MLLLRVFGPNTDTSHERGHWSNYMWLASTSGWSSAGSGGSYGGSPDGLWALVGVLRVIRTPESSKKKDEKWYHEIGKHEISPIIKEFTMFKIIMTMFQLIMKWSYLFFIFVNMIFLFIISCIFRYLIFIIFFNYLFK